MHAADLDGDGDADVLGMSGSLEWYENQGGGEFSGPLSISSSGEFGGHGSVHAADLDGDGDQDVLAAGNGVAWYENQGGGSFLGQHVIAETSGAESVLAVDLDGDGDPDVLSASQGDDTVAWYENQSDHGDDHGDTPDSATLAATLPALLLGNVESSGDRDVFRVATGSGTLRVYSNGPADTAGSLLDADGAVLARDDDSGARLNFLVEADVTAGTHYIEVRGSNDDIGGPYTLSVEMTLHDVAQFLEENPRIAAAMSWSGVDNQPKPYAEWPQTLKGKLDMAVRRQLKGDGSGLPDVMTNRVADVLDDDDGLDTVLSKEDAEDLYVANIAHSLVLEMNGALAWSLDDLSEHELALLLSGSRVGHPNAVAIGGQRNGGFYNGYGDFSGCDGLSGAWLGFALVARGRPRVHVTGESRRGYPVRDDYQGD